MSVLGSISSSKISSNYTKREQLSMTVREETLGVGLNLRYREAGPGVSSISAIDTRCEWSSETSNGDPSVIITNRVGEGDSWWTRSPVACLVDVSGGSGW
jgi:hypothetical protein